MIPGASVRVSAPWRPATRLITRSVYSSSSLVPVSTWSTIETAAITSAASSASPNESIPQHLGEQLVGEHQGAGVGEQHQEEAGDERERQPQRGEQRRQDGVDDRDHRGDEEGPAGVVDRDPGDEPGGDVDGDRGDHPGDRQPQGAQAWFHRLPLDPRSGGIGHP